MCRGRALTHRGALWRVLSAAFRKQYMGLGKGLRIGARDRKEERRVYGTWEGQVRNRGLGRGKACYRRQSRYPIAPSEGRRICRVLRPWMPPRARRATTFAGRSPHPSLGPRVPRRVCRGPAERRPSSDGPAGARASLCTASVMYGCGYNSCGCNLRLYEFRSGVMWGRFRAGLGPLGPQAGPKSPPNEPDRTSDNLKLQPHELQPHR